MKRIVITGMGAVTPVGIGVEEYWKNITAGESGIDTIKTFDPSELAVQIAGEVKNFNPSDYLAKDLLDGAKNLSKLHDEFVKSEMWKYCIYIADSYNETAVGQEEYLNQNRLMTEFVLDMNYSMLYSNAFAIVD